MAFWIIAALLTFLATLSVVIPLSRRPATAEGELDPDRAVYHARIAEIDSDLELGRISETEATAARAEEARRLIARAGQVPESGQPGGRVSTTTRKAAMLASFLLVPAIALPVYLSLGAPDQPDQSLASRMSADPASQPIDDLLGRAEAHLARNPDDAQGWRVVAPVYARMQRYDDAVRAFANVLRLEPQDPEVRGMLAEMLVARSDGMVTADARKLFEDQLALDPASARARFYLALALTQEGKTAEAIEAWDLLIAGANPQAPWLEAARQMRGQLAGAGNTPAGPGSPGPSQEQVEAAQEMPAQDRMAMIETMVAGLAERLRDDPSDKAAWQRLVRSYIVLGKKDEARTAIETALLHHGADTAFAETMRQARDSIGN